VRQASVVGIETGFGLYDQGVGVESRYGQEFSFKGRAVTQGDSRRLPTAVARVRIRAACGVCGGQNGTGAGVLRVFRFPLPIIPPISPLSYSPRAGTKGLLVAAVPIGPNWTPPPALLK
jgi:hypothetical protein